MPPARAPPSSTRGLHGNGSTARPYGTRQADARVSYNLPFESEFAPVDNGVGNGRYQALLQLGGTY